MSDTLMRQWQMLRLIPRHPSSISTTELQFRLADEGFTTHQRTIQRDLALFETIYPLVCDDQSKPFGWSWMANADVMDIPGMDSHTALAFVLAGKYLEPLLPTSTIRHLAPHFAAAKNVLDRIQTKQGVPGWMNKVRVINRGPTLSLPKIDPAVQESVYKALLLGNRLNIRYQPRANPKRQEYEINPLGLVLKDGLAYLVCTFWDYVDIRLLTLHRMQTAKCLDTPSTTPTDFSLDGYISAGKLGFVIGKQIALTIIINKEIGYHLQERPLHPDQIISSYDQDQLLLKATVKNTNELRWWLLGFGDQVEVVEPETLRNEFKEIALNMGKRYAKRTLK